MHEHEAATGVTQEQSTFQQHASHVPGPTQLSVLSALQATKSWAGPGNEASNMHHCTRVIYWYNEIQMFVHAVTWIFVHFSFTYCDVL